MTESNYGPEPTSEDLARAMWEAVGCIGLPTSRSEKDYITNAAAMLLTRWLLANGHSEEWLLRDVEGPIAAASRLGYEQHLRLKEAKALKGR